MSLAKRRIRHHLADVQLFPVPSKSTKAIYPENAINKPIPTSDTDTASVVIVTLAAAGLAVLFLVSLLSYGGWPQ